MTEDELLDGIVLDMSLNGLGELVMDWEPWRPSIHGVTKSQTRRSTELSIHQSL